MNGNTEKTIASGRLQSLVGYIRKIMAEDPLIGGFFLILILPSGFALWGAVQKVDKEMIIIIMLLIPFFVITVFLPLLLLRATKGDKAEITKIRIESLEDEKVRMQKSWESDQSLKNRIIEAKIENLNAKTNFLHEQSDKYEKALLYQISEDISKGMKATLDSIEYFPKKDFSSFVEMVLKGFKDVDKNYDSVLAYMAKFEDLVDNLKEKYQIKDEVSPDISVVDKIPVLDKQVPSSPIETKISVQQSPSDEVPIGDGQIESGRFNEAMHVIESLKDDTIGVKEDPGEKEDSEGPPTDPEYEAPLNAWICSDCGRVNPLKKARCNCGSSKGAQ